jgi:protein translocase SecG subunit
MNLSMLGAIAWWAQMLAIIFIIVCMVLIVIVLLQKGRGGGLSAAFGGAGGQSAFGSKTGDVFTWATIVIVGVFLILAMVLTANYKPYVELEQPATTLKTSAGAQTTSSGATEGGAAAPTAAPSGAAATARAIVEDHRGSHHSAATVATVGIAASSRMFRQAENGTWRTRGPKAHAHTTPNAADR